MARGQETAFAKARKIAKQQADLAVEQAEVNKAVAAEAADLLVENRGFMLDPAKLAKIVRLSVELGEDEAVSRLQAKAA